MFFGLHNVISTHKIPYLLYWNVLRIAQFLKYCMSHMGHLDEVVHRYSSVASCIWQEGQSERTFPIFLFSPIFSLFFPSFLIFSLFSPLVFGNFFAVKGGTLPSLTPQWLYHCTDYNFWVKSIFIFTWNVKYQVLLVRANLWQQIFKMNNEHVIFF